MTLRVIFLATLTMMAFAANSLFGRWALTDPLLDPASYTSVRIASGALMLCILVIFNGGFGGEKSEGSLISALALLAYAAFFSYAYISLDTGIGALILFACVQAVMIGWGLVSGERPKTLAWVGIVSALVGFFYLVSPGLSAPDPLGAVLMAISGVAWGVYSLRGRGMRDPLKATMTNFVIATPFAIALSLIMLNQFEISFKGALLAVASGAITSAMGYALWYNILKYFTATNAAILQLTVPVIATVFGIIILSEPITLRIVIASIAILGGVALTLFSKQSSS